MYNYIFDIGGVLINYSIKLLIKHLSSESGISEEEIFTKITYDLLFQVETGKMKGLDFYNNYIRPMVKHWAYDDWINAWRDNYSVNFHGYDLFCELKEKGYPVYILSNLADYNRDALERMSNDFLAQSDHNFYSFELGLHKPNIEIYKKVCEHLNVKPESCVFFDDRLENIESAEKFGMIGLHFSEENIGKIRKKVFSL